MFSMQLKVSESRWTVSMASLAMVGMLVLFHAVVSDAVKAGELRRQAMAAQFSAVLQCNAMPSWSDSKACVKGLDARVAADAPTLLAAQ